MLFMVVVQHSARKKSSHNGILSGGNEGWKQTYPLILRLMCLLKKPRVLEQEDGMDGRPLFQSYPKTVLRACCTLGGNIIFSL
jgi:hypothetical protein